MRITLPSGTPAELATPTGGREASRGLVIVPDIMGLRPLFVDHAQRIADQQGWAVCVFEPWPGREGLSLQERFELGHTLSDTRMLGDAAAAADVCSVGPVSVMGFCMGGMFTLKAAGTGRFQRAVSFYGMVRVPEDRRGDDQVSPLDALASPQRCPTLALMGTADTLIPADDVDELEKVGVTVVRYEGAEHGFAHDPDRPAHRPEEAADAWSRALTFLGAST